MGELSSFVSQQILHLIKTDPLTSCHGDATILKAHINVQNCNFKKSFCTQIHFKKFYNCVRIGAITSEVSFCCSDPALGLSASGLVWDNKNFGDDSLSQIFYQKHVQKKTIHGGGSVLLFNICIL